MGPNEQNLTELRQKFIIFIQRVVLLRGLSSFFVKHKRFFGKKEKKKTVILAWVRQTEVFTRFL